MLEYQSPQVSALGGNPYGSPDKAVGIWFFIWLLVAVVLVLLLRDGENNVVVDI